MFAKTKMQNGHSNGGHDEAGSSRASLMDDQHLGAVVHEEETERDSSIGGGSMKALRERTLRLSTHSCPARSVGWGAKSQAQEAVALSIPQTFGLEESDNMQRQPAQPLPPPHHEHEQGQEQQQQPPQQQQQQQQHQQQQQFQVAGFVVDDDDDDEAGACFQLTAGLFQVYVRIVLQFFCGVAFAGSTRCVQRYAWWVRWLGLVVGHCLGMVALAMYRADLPPQKRAVVGAVVLVQEVIVAYAYLVAVRTWCAHHSYRRQFTQQEQLERPTVADWARSRRTEVHHVADEEAGKLWTAWMVVFWTLVWLAFLVLFGMGIVSWMRLVAVATGVPIFSTIVTGFNVEIQRAHRQMRSLNAVVRGVNPIAFNVGGIAVHELESGVRDSPASTCEQIRLFWSSVCLLGHGNERRSTDSHSSTASKQEGTAPSPRFVSLSEVRRRYLDVEKDCVSVSHDWGIALGLTIFLGAILVVLELLFVVVQGVEKYKGNLLYNLTIDIPFLLAMVITLLILNNKVDRFRTCVHSVHPSTPTQLHGIDLERMTKRGCPLEAARLRQYRAWFLAEKCDLLAYMDAHPLVITVGLVDYPLTTKEAMGTLILTLLSVAGQILALLDSE